MLAYKQQSIPGTNILLFCHSGSQSRVTKGKVKARWGEGRQTGRGTQDGKETVGVKMQQAGGPAKSRGSFRRAVMSTAFNAFCVVLVT